MKDVVEKRCYHNGIGSTCDPIDNTEDPMFDKYDETFVNHRKNSEQPLWSGYTKIIKLSFILELY